MSLSLLYTKPGHLARRFQQIAVAIFMEETAQFGITPVQYATLTALRDNRDIDATTLAQLVAFDRSTLGNVLGRLEAKRLIDQRRSKDDQRAKRLRLTPAGVALLKKVEPAVRRADARIIAPVSVKDRKRLLELLSQLVHLNNKYSRAPLGERSADAQRRRPARPDQGVHSDEGDRHSRVRRSGSLALRRRRAPDTRTR
jgi:MarR family transcriptional regulator, lower aerobic nicotinate degradation pathway regulator